MIFHIRFLKLILGFGLTALPVGLGVNMSYFLSAAVKKRGLLKDYLGMIVAYGTVLLAVLWLDQAGGVGAFSSLGSAFTVSSFLWLPVSVAAGLLCIAAEYGVGILLLKIRHVKRAPGFTVHQVYGSLKRVSPGDAAGVFIFVVLEELLFRFVLTEYASEMLSESGLISRTAAPGIALQQGDVPGTILIIAVGAIVFALNHVHWGWSVSAQKFISGVIFMTLYLLSGGCLITVITAHLMQNYFLLFSPGKRRKET